MEFLTSSRVFVGHYAIYYYTINLVPVSSLSSSPIWYYYCFATCSRRLFLQSMTSISAQMSQRAQLCTHAASGTPEDLILSEGARSPIAAAVVIYRRCIRNLDAALCHEWPLSTQHTSTHTHAHRERSLQKTLCPHGVNCLSDVLDVARVHWAISSSATAVGKGGG